MSGIEPAGIPDRLGDDVDAGATDLGASSGDAYPGAVGDDLIDGGLTGGADDDSDTELIDDDAETAGIADDGSGEIASGDAR